MRWLFIFSVIFSVSFVSCKSKQKTHNDNDKIVEQPAQTNGEYMGVVHHNYEESTCSVVVVNVGEEDMVLIPVNGLPEAMDIDGMQIRFNYHALKMPQPEGCTSGIPVELTDVVAQK